MIIDVGERTIEVKSEHENYVDEAAGVRCYTLRSVMDLDASMLRGLEKAVKDAHEAATIVIEDKSTSGNDEPDRVRRQITDIHFEGKFAGRELVGISWRHTGVSAG